MNGRSNILDEEVNTNDAGYGEEKANGGHFVIAAAKAGHRVFADKVRNHFFFFTLYKTIVFVSRFSFGQNKPNVK